MNSNERKIVTAKKQVICSNITSLTQIIVVLESEFVIDDIDVQNINAQPTPFERNKKLVDILQTKENGFRALVHALREAGQKWIADELVNHQVNQGGNHQNVSPHALSQGANSGVQINEMHGGSAHTYVAHGNITFNGKP